MYSEDYERPRAQERNPEDVYSKPIRAGKRTYFFDVKSTKGNNDFYLTITESGSFTYDKHKIVLYKEDFEKFQEGLQDAVHYILHDLLHDQPIRQYPAREEQETSEEEF